MKNVLQDAELKAFLEKAYIPQADASRNVMNIIEAGGKTPLKKDKRSLVLILLPIVIICCSAFTIAYNVWELKNTNGDTIMQVHESNIPKQIIVINEYDDLYKEIKPGDCEFLYDARTDKPSVTTFCKPLSLTSVYEARKNVPFDFKVPSVPDGYQLTSIDIQSVPLKEPDLELFKKEAAASGKNYFTKAISESEKSKLLKFKYVKDKKEIMFSIFRAEGIDMYTDASINKTIKTIKIGNVDAFYYKDKYTMALTLREEIDGSEHSRIVTKNGNTYEEICKYYIQYDAFVAPIKNGVTEDDLVNLLEGLK